VLAQAGGLRIGILSAVGVSSDAYYVNVPQATRLRLETTDNDSYRQGAHR
jgi:hypothetical protein